MERLTRLGSAVIEHPLPEAGPGAGGTTVAGSSRAWLPLQPPAHRAQLPIPGAASGAGNTDEEEDESEWTRPMNVGLF